MSLPHPPPPANEPAMLSIAAAAQRLSMGASTLYRLVARGEFPPEFVCRRGRNVWIRADGIQGYVDRLTEAPIVPMPLTPRRSDGRARRAG